METKERICLWVVAFLLTIAGIILFGPMCQAQYVPSILAPDCAVLAAQNQTLQLQLNVKNDSLRHERKRNAELSASGTLAITGLQTTVKAANDTIKQREAIIRQVVGERDQQKARADSAVVQKEQALKERDDATGRTVVGRWIRSTRDGLAVVGAVVITVVTIRFATLL